MGVLFPPPDKKLPSPLDDITPKELTVAMMLGVSAAALCPEWVQRIPAYPALQAIQAAQQADDPPYEDQAPQPHRVESIDVSSTAPSTPQFFKRPARNAPGVFGAFVSRR